MCAIRARVVDVAESATCFCFRVGATPASRFEFAGQHAKMKFNLGVDGGSDACFRSHRQAEWSASGPEIGIHESGSVEHEEERLEVAAQFNDFALQLLSPSLGE